MHIKEDTQDLCELQPDEEKLYPYELNESTDGGIVLCVDCLELTGQGYYDDYIPICICGKYVCKQCLIQRLYPELLERINRMSYEEQNQVYDALRIHSREQPLIEKLGRKN